MTDPFADIRPYRDEEVPAVLARLTHDPELLDALASLRLGWLARLAPALCRPLVRHYLGRQLRGVSDVHGMQMVVKAYMDRMIEDTTGGFSVSGLDQLDPARPYLFMSNHRDIAMDPAFTNYALHRGGHQTIRIAIGDNLLTKPWVSDLMRLNKSFIVKRSVSGPRELLAASRNLSAYIRHSLLEERAPVWIAQREGRAKNGIDRTEPAVIKMLAMSRDKQQASFAEHISELAIVPVAISYELDPCDALKAKELHQLASTGSYQKAAQEDVASIGRGIAGQKGRVHVSFGRPLTGDYADADAVAAAVDDQIVAEYCLHPSNIHAYRMLHGEDAPLPESLYREQGDCSASAFRARIEAMPEAHRPYALAIYANAVVSKLARLGKTPAPC
ncbi:1-acyl-sn-glycerol-3-phosphate acyltransferase [Parahaliea aestuarii]|uniref:Glycerol acyltransferase n=1 Tax=Parahaliea aestuarii TaxID=1852021 RepID=A0A5C8ZPP5_9GAMM|nr:1-acyl-sn-glycerol-3-phosphate acyltransferase [Parahaliea aestuarii]TXS90476.1 glycerol acyltransferase [Parahaliea aestuarii]